MQKIMVLSVVDFSHVPPTLNLSSKRFKKVNQARSCFDRAHDLGMFHGDPDVSKKSIV